MSASLFKLYDFSELESVKIRDNGVSFKIKGISSTILIRAHWDVLTAESQARDYNIKSNYAIITPLQPRPYIPSGIWAADENQAILEYVTCMLEFYNLACQKYHYKPRESWLRPLTNYFSGGC